MAYTYDANQFAKMLNDTLRAECTKAADAAVEEVVKRVRESVRERLGAIAVKLFDHYSLERMGKDLVITVKFDPPKEAS
jgi:hypothetical protein